MVESFHYRCEVRFVNGRDHDLWLRDCVGVEFYSGGACGGCRWRRMCQQLSWEFDSHGLVYKLVWFVSLVVVNG